MENKPYIVYVRTDDAGNIAAVHSSAFLSDAAGWTEVDSGFGDRCHHAQGNYFSKPIRDERGICRYKLADGVPVERTPEEMDADYTEPEQPVTIEKRVETVEGKTAELEESLEMLLSGVTEDE